VKSRAVPLLVKQREWAEAIDSAVSSSDAALIGYVLKGISQWDQQVMSNESVLHNLTALNGWLRLQGNQVNRTELLEKAGLTKDSLLMQFMGDGDVGVLKEKVKASKDALTAEMLEKQGQMLKACEAVGTGFRKGMTAYELFDMAIEKGQGKAVAKILKLSDEEVFVRRLKWALKRGNMEVLGEIGREGSDEMLLNAVLFLAEEGRFGEAAGMRELIKDEGIAADAERELQKVRARD
jgi:hypothetical protein